MKKLIAITMAVVLLLTLVVAAPVVAKPAVWHVPVDFATIQEALDSTDVADGDTILVGPGSHAGTLVTRAVEIKGKGGAVIDSGPVYSGLIYGFLLLTGSDGATISHLRFEVDFPIMGSFVNDVTVKHCTLINPLQGISNWGGSRWQISHNNIVDLRTACGGGIGILIADWTAVEGGVNDNLVSHNKITGTLHVAEGDCGGYDGAGINLYADFRWGADGAEKITNNRVVHNKVSLTSDNPDVVDVAAIALEDTRDDADADPYLVIFDNVIGFNDLRGTLLQLDYTPEGLDEGNTISRNLGDNRGHGVVPADIFRPA
ncbi:hypothetical protein ES703_72730 [subsurface metagenome]